MAQNFISEEEVKKALQVNSFREISKEKIMEFVSLIPQMDKEVAIAIINQFPTYAESASSMITQLTIMCDNIIKDNTSSQRDAVEAYKKILDDLGGLLKKETISQEEREIITNQMILVADKIAIKDTENKKFLIDIIRHNAPIIGGVLILGATILGVSVKGTKMPSIGQKS